MGIPARADKPTTAAATAAATPIGPVGRKLKKGEILFSEGEMSRAMYFVKSGIIRIFKKKGDASIEIDTIRSGSVLGELAFLDGNPRSASGEALTDCELVEISGATFQETLSRMPDWLKILLKTVVSRLRASSNRIRQLESASTAIDYGKDGKNGTKYVYISVPDALKLATAVLVVGARNGKEIEGGLELRAILLQRYANQIMGVPVAKLTTFLDVLAQGGVLSSGDGEQGIVLKDIDFLEKLIAYLNEENLLEESKRHNLSIKGFVVMSYLARHVGKYEEDKATGLTRINLAEIRRAETANNGGKEPFRIEDAQELVKVGYMTQLESKSNEEMFTQVKADKFMLHYRCQRVVMAINAVNEQKRKGGAAAR